MAGRYLFFVLVFLISSPHAVLISSGDGMRRSTSSHRFSGDSEFCVVDGPKKVQNVGKIKMANAIRPVRNEEMGLKKTPKMFQVPRSKPKHKINSKEPDEYATCSETNVVLQS